MSLAAADLSADVPAGIDFAARFAAPAPTPGEAEAWVRERVEAAGSSFVWGLKLLSAPRRRAMFAVYAFCREVDDIADEPGPLAERQAAIGLWREEIRRLCAGEPVTHPIAVALVEPVRRYALSERAFMDLIDGMETDLHGALQGPDRSTLALYCRQVAGAPGLLTLEVLGERGPEAERLAVCLGEALQLTNILRDRSEDASRGRLYLPAEALDAAGIASRDPQTAVDDPRVRQVCDSLAAEAHARFAEARRLIAACRRTPRPAVIMMEVYWRQLLRMQAANWRTDGTAAKLSKPAKLWVALRYGLF
jgi:phytoene synthase